MKNWWKNWWLSNDTKHDIADISCIKKENINTHSQHIKKIEKGAKDFAVRFEDVMKELANG